MRLMMILSVRVGQRIDGAIRRFMFALNLRIHLQALYMEIVTYSWGLRRSDEEMEDNDMMPLICIRCKKDIPLTVKTFEEVSYTHYSYCEECLRKGLKALKAWDLLYKRIYDHHYEILKMEEGEVKRAKLSLSNWVLDLMTGELDYDYVPGINVGKKEEEKGEKQ